jgi:hypothetical protein
VLGDIRGLVSHKQEAAKRAERAKNYPFAVCGPVDHWYVKNEAEEPKGRKKRASEKEGAKEIKKAKREINDGNL